MLTAVDGVTPGLVDDPVAEARKAKHVSRERILGYLDALGAAGITPLVHLQPGSDDEEAHAAARTLLARDDRPTGVLCFSDVIASGVYAAAQELGLDVPGDVSVVGFDDNPLARRLRPQLTTVHQDVAAKGRAAAAALLTAMRARREGTQGRARHVILPARLLVRSSTASPQG